MAIDRQYHGTVEGEVGSCQDRLESLGELLQVVVGYWGETSTDLDMIIRAIAESMVLYLSRETGRLITDNWVGQVLGQHRRSLLVAFVRAQAACLTSRMGHLGVGVRELPCGDCFADSTILGFNTTRIPHFQTPKKHSKLGAVGIRP